MRKRPPATVWVSVILLIGVIAVLTWQAMDVFQTAPLAASDPGALVKAGLILGATLGAVWLLEGVPALLLLTGARLWRTVVTIAAVPGLFSLIFHWQPNGWGPLLVSLKAIQLFAILLLYVAPGRGFFQRRVP